MITIGPPIPYHCKGFGVEPCPGCGKLSQPEEPLIVRAGEWRSWHKDCFRIQQDLEEVL